MHRCHPLVRREAAALDSQGFLTCDELLASFDEVVSGAVVLFLIHAKLHVPERLEPSLVKVRAALERDDLRSPDLKKLSGSGYFRLKLDYDARLLVSFVQHAGKRACLALEKFSTPLVFSIHEAKGLEYDTAILYDMVSSERARSFVT